MRVAKFEMCMLLLLCAFVCARCGVARVPCCLASGPSAHRFMFDSGLRAL